MVAFTTWDALDGPTEWEVDRAREAEYEAELADGDAWLSEHPNEPHPDPAVYAHWVAKRRKAEFALQIAADERQEAERNRLEAEMEAAFEAWIATHTEEWTRQEAAALEYQQAMQTGEAIYHAPPNPPRRIRLRS